MEDAESADRLVSAFARWAASERIAAAVTARARQRSLLQQAGSSATWAGALLDLAERQAPVGLAIGDFRLSGLVVGVGGDFVVLRAGGGRPVLIRHAAIAAVWPEHSTAGPPTGDRPPAIDLTFTSALGWLADERSPVLLRAGDFNVEGELTTVAEDFVTVRTGHPGRRSVFVPLAAIGCCEVR